MREQLIQYVKLLFAGTPDSEDMQQEILQNTLDRYDDLVEQGKTPEAAYRLAIAGIGDINEVLGNQDTVSHAQAENTDYRGRPLPSSRQKIMRAIAIALYICCVIPVILLSNVGDGIIGVCLMFVMIAVATVLIIISSGGSKEERAEKVNEKEPTNPIYKAYKSASGAITLAIYLIISFWSGAWYITWLIFPISGAIDGIVKALFHLKAEKRSATVRIILYSLLTILVAAILCGCLFMGDFYYRFTDGIVAEGDVGLDPTKFRAIEIDWACGKIDIYTADTNKIIISERLTNDDDPKMVYTLEDETLTIHHGTNSIFPNFGSLSVPEKDLIIIVPQDWVCSDLEIDGASLDIEIRNLTVDTLSLDGASCSIDFIGAVNHVEMDGASANIRLNCTNRVSSIDVDGAACNLYLTLPQGCGFHLKMDGLSCKLNTDLPGVTSNDQTYYADGHCRIEVDGIGCVVTIAEECIHEWGPGMPVVDTETCESVMMYTCMICKKSSTNGPTFMPIWPTE